MLPHATPDGVTSPHYHRGYSTPYCVTWVTSPHYHGDTLSHTASHGLLYPYHRRLSILYTTEITAHLTTEGTLPTTTEVSHNLRVLTTGENSKRCKQFKVDEPRGDTGFTTRLVWWLDGGIEDCKVIASSEEIE